MVDASLDPPDNLCSEANPEGQRCEAFLSEEFTHFSGTAQAVRLLEFTEIPDGSRHSATKCFTALPEGVTLCQPGVERGERSEPREGPGFEAKENQGTPTGWP